MAIAADGKALYVVNYECGTVTKLRARTWKPLQTIDACYHPIGITFDTATKRVWVACYTGAILRLQRLVTRAAIRVFGCWKDRLGSQVGPAQSWRLPRPTSKTPCEATHASISHFHHRLSRGCARRHAAREHGHGRRDEEARACDVRRRLRRRLDQLHPRGADGALTRAQGPARPARLPASRHLRLSVSGIDAAQRPPGGAITRAQSR